MTNISTPKILAGNQIGQRPFFRHGSAGNQLLVEPWEIVAADTGEEAKYWGAAFAWYFEAWKKISCHCQLRYWYWFVELNQLNLLWKLYIFAYSYEKNTYSCLPLMYMYIIQVNVSCLCLIIRNTYLQSIIRRMHILSIR